MSDFETINHIQLCFLLARGNLEGQNDSKPLYSTLFRKISSYFVTYALIQLHVILY